MAGVAVVVDRSGRVSAVSGLVPIAQTTAEYPLRSGSAAVQAALTPPPASTSSLIPEVALTRVDLVDSVARAGAQGYPEPAYLFSGTFVLNGQTLEKRVLVPALDIAAIQP